MLCLEILAKRGCAFTLKYIRGSVADVDCRLSHGSCGPHPAAAAVAQRHLFRSGLRAAQVGRHLRAYQALGVSQVHLLYRDRLPEHLSIMASFGTWFQLSLLYIALSTVINEALQGNADIIETAIEIIYLFLLLLQISRSRAVQPEPAQGPTAAWAAPRPARENVGEVRSM